MKISMSKEKLIENLSKKFNEDQIDNIIEILNRFPIIATDFNHGSIHSDDDSFDIELRTKDGILTTNMFIPKISGIDPNIIISAELPKLSVEDINVLKLKLEVYPFEVKFPILKS